MPLETIVAFDRYCILSVSAFQSPWLDPGMIALTKVGDMGAVWLIGTATLLLWQKYRYEGAVIFSGLALNTVLGE
jgi:hypothetical protein